MAIHAGKKYDLSILLADFHDSPSMTLHGRVIMVILLNNGLPLSSAAFLMFSRITISRDTCLNLGKIQVFLFGCQGLFRPRGDVPGTWPRRLFF